MPARKIPPDPLAYAPFALRAPAAARYVGFSESKFYEAVNAGTLPAPRRQGRVAVWLRDELEEAIRNLPTSEEDERDEWAERISL
ncbi:MAG: hypothetical protein AAGJ94_06055 [Pseudomonadota bacterium]